MKKVLALVFVAIIAGAIVATTATAMYATPIIKSGLCTRKNCQTVPVYTITGNVTATPTETPGIPVFTITPRPGTATPVPTSYVSPTIPANCTPVIEPPLFYCYNPGTITPTP